MSRRPLWGAMLAYCVANPAFAADSPTSDSGTDSVDTSATPTEDSATLDETTPLADPTVETLPDADATASTELVSDTLDESPSTEEDADLSLETDADVLDPAPDDFGTFTLDADNDDALADAEPIEGVSKKEYKYLKPKQWRLPANPRSQIDYTAYTLEWGEWRIGTGTLGVGIAPRTQISTAPLLNLLGIYNGMIKTNPFRLADVDLSLHGSVAHLPLGNFKGTYYTMGGGVSYLPLDWLGVHTQLAYRKASVSGIPTQLPALFRGLVDTSQVDEVITRIEEVIASPAASADTLNLKFAADFKLNKRDSIVIQFQGMPYVKARGDMGVNGDIEELLDEASIATSFDTRTPVNFGDTYAITASWQFTFRRLDLRLGGGTSGIPYQWALQANDFAVRAGGKTRRTDKKRRKAWRANKDDMLDSRKYAAVALAPEPSDTPWATDAEGFDPEEWVDPNVPLPVDEIASPTAAETDLVPDASLQDTLDESAAPGDVEAATEVTPDDDATGEADSDDSAGDAEGDKAEEVDTPAE